MFDKKQSAPSEIGNEENVVSVVIEDGEAQPAYTTPAPEEKSKKPRKEKKPKAEKAPKEKKTRKEKPVKEKKVKKEKPVKVSKKDRKAAEKEAKKAAKAEAAAHKQRVSGNPVRNLIVTAVLSVLVGVAFIVKPNYPYYFGGYVLGGLVGLFGIIYIILYFCHRPIGGVYRNEFGIGLVALVAGAYVAVGGLVFSNNAIAFSITLVVKLLGILVALDGVMKLQYTLDLARMKYKNWWVVLIVGVVGLAIGVLTVMQYIADWGTLLGTMLGMASFTYMTMMGACFCLNGVCDILALSFIANRNHRANREALQAAKEAELEAVSQGLEVGKVQDFFPAEGTSVAGETALSEEAPAEAELPDVEVAVFEENPPEAAE